MGRIALLAKRIPYTTNSGKLESFSNSSVLATTCVPETWSSGGMRGICSFWAIKMEPKEGGHGHGFLLKNGVVLVWMGAKSCRWFIPLFVRSNSLRAHFFGALYTCNACNGLICFFDLTFKFVSYLKGFNHPRWQWCRISSIHGMSSFQNCAPTFFRVSSALLPP